MKGSGLASYSRIGSHYVVPTAGVEAPIENFVLDTNVLIDIEHFYVGKGRPELRPAVLRLLWALRDERLLGAAPTVEYPFALAENHHRRLGPSPSSRSMFSEGIVQTALAWTRDELQDIARDPRPPARGRGVPLSRAAPPGPVFGLAVNPTYAALLYASHLEQHSTDRSIAAANFERWVDWLYDELDVAGPYEIAVARRLLAGTPTEHREARAFLKLRGGRYSADQLADRSWNAAWDIWMLRYTEARTVGHELLGGQPVPSALITNDRWAAWLRGAGRVRALFAGAAGVYDMAVETELAIPSGLTRSANDALDRAFGRLTAPANAARARRSVPDQTVKAVEAIERRVGVGS